MADVVVYTANFGGYDHTVAQQPQDVDVDWLFLTDGIALPDRSLDSRMRWRVEPVEPEGHPNQAAKRYKAQPPWELGDWTHAIWIDANMEVTSPSFVREAIAAVNDGVAIWQHPRRECLYDEVLYSRPGGKESQGDRYANLDLDGQAAAYRAEGYPAKNGLVASGTIVWTRPASEKLGRAWLDEIERWGFHDQIAFPVVAWRLGLRPGLFPIPQIERRFTTMLSPRQRLTGEPSYLGNRWLRIHPHSRLPDR